MTILFTTDGNRQQCAQYLRIYFALVGPAAVFHVVELDRGMHGTGFAYLCS